MLDLRVLALTSSVFALAAGGCGDSDSSGDTSSTGGSTSGTDSATDTSGSTTDPDGDPRCAGENPSEFCCSADGAWTCTGVGSCDERADLHAACGFEVDEDWRSSCERWEERVDNGNSCEQQCYSSSLSCMLATPESCEDPAGKEQTCQALQDDEACQFDNCGDGSTGGAGGTSGAGSTGEGSTSGAGSTSG